MADTPQEKLAVCVVQSSPVWEDRTSSLHDLDALLDRLPPVDLLLLPEMFSTGFSMNTVVTAEPSEGPSLAWMRRLAARTGAFTTGTVAVAEDGRVYNRCYGVCPSGETLQYNKRHLFRMGGEHMHFTPGCDRVIWRWKGWRLLPQVCYDLRFPVWSRNRNDYDLALYATNWPAPRHEVLLALARARALENSCYLAFSNRTGCDGAGVGYAGNASVFDFRGRVLADAGGLPGWATVTLSYGALARFRDKFPVGMDGDDFKLIP